MLRKINKWFGKVGTYRIITDRISYKNPAFIVEVRGLLWWHIVKVFTDEDERYAHLCATELLENLQETI